MALNRYLLFRKESGSNSSQSQPVASSPSSPSAAPEGSSSPAASTASPSPSSSPTSNTDQDVKLDCPNIDGKKQTFDKKWTFEYHCGKDFTGSKYDIIFIASYNLEDCVKACMSYNTNRRSNECTAVEFNASELRSLFIVTLQIYKSTATRDVDDVYMLTWGHASNRYEGVCREERDERHCYEWGESDTAGAGSSSTVIKRSLGTVQDISNNTSYNMKVRQ